MEMICKQLFKGWRIEVKSPVEVLCFGFVPEL
jgi:hypothetical protein